MIKRKARIEKWICMVGMVFVFATQCACQTQEVKPDKTAAAIIQASAYPDIQAALDAVPKGGGKVILPPGNFKLTKPLLFTRENTLIQGSGPATHIMNENQEGKPALILRHKEYEKKKNLRIWRVQLSDFRISGNPKSGAGILAQGVNEIFIHGVSIDHNGGHGINLVNCYEDPRVADSIITYNKQAGLNILAGHDIVVNANQFEENQDAIRCIDSFNLCMNGNNLDDHLGNGVVIENTYGSVLSGNMIEECQGIAVVLDRDCYGNTISANVLAHNGGGVDLRDAWGCAVSANTFTMDAKLGLKIGPDSGRITVTGNNFSNAHIGDKRKRDDPAMGILLENTKDVVITGNIFSGMTAEAIKAIGNCQRIVNVGNIITDYSRMAAGKYPAVNMGTTKPVSGNNIIDSPR
jgi:parallel beta-helix repeat protein